MKTREEIDELFRQAKNGLLPNNFQDWNLTTIDNWTVAHEAAFWGHLPDDFNQWNLKDDYGTTVADIAAKNNTLPRNFKC